MIYVCKMMISVCKMTIYVCVKKPLTVILPIDFLKEFVQLGYHLIDLLLLLCSLALQHQPVSTTD